MRSPRSASSPDRRTGSTRWATNPQLAARGFFRTMLGSSTRFPGPFARMTASPWHSQARDARRGGGRWHVPRQGGFGTDRRRFELERKDKGRLPGSAVSCSPRPGPGRMPRNCSPCSAPTSSSLKPVAGSTVGAARTRTRSRRRSRTPRAPNTLGTAIRSTTRSTSTSAASPSTCRRRKASASSRACCRTLTSSPRTSRRG